MALAVVFLTATMGLFCLNFVITGEANYQGAADRVSRRSFIDHYPFDSEVRPSRNRGTR